MGKINWYLRRLFITFNIKFAISGCFLIYLAVKSSAYSHQLLAVSSQSLVWIWLFAIGVLGISCLGVYAGYSEKKILLKIFAGFMVVGMIIMLIFGIVTFVTRNKIKPNLESIISKVAKHLMEDNEFRTLLEELQQDAQCCVVVSASDWGDNIPSSCKCSGSRYRSYGRSECTSKPQGVSGPDRIYAKPCIKVMISLSDSAFKAAMPWFFGFAAIALLGLLVSYMMIHQVEHHDSMGGTSIAMWVY